MALVEIVERPELEGPVLVLALDGWIDAGAAATTARELLKRQLHPVTVAVFDSDDLLDHRARRPTVHLVDGVTTGFTWPAIELLATSDPQGNDMLVLAGAEPDHRWRAFSRSVADLALDFGARMVVSLGAYPAPVPHTRPVRLSVAASDTDLIPADVERATVDAPAGVHAAIERRAAELGLPTVALWAQVPHYVATMPYPAAAAALLDGLNRVAGLHLDYGELGTQGADVVRHIDELVSANPDHGQMVRRLEESVDAGANFVGGEANSLGDGPLPSGDELAAELERYLRGQGEGRG
jgi:proteasome assembly chaperone (PAC2) family protein